MNQLASEILKAIKHTETETASPAAIANTIQCPVDVVEDCLLGMENGKLIHVSDTSEGIVVGLTPESREMVQEETVAPSAYVPHDWQGIQRFDMYCLPYPTVLLGSGTALWDNIKHEICPSCKNQQLQEYEFCLRCDNWGMDSLLNGNSGPNKNTKSLQRLNK